MPRMIAKSFEFGIKKETVETVSFLVELVRVELTSYAATKKPSTYLVYLLFLDLITRVNTLYKPQKAK